MTEFKPLVALWLLSVAVNAGAHAQSSSPYFGWDAHFGSVLCVASNHDGTMLASGGADGTVRLWNVPTGTSNKVFLKHSSEVSSVSFSPDGTMLVSGGGDKTVNLWDVRTGILLRSFIGATSPVKSVSFSPDGKKIASGSWNGAVTIWALDTSFRRVISDENLLINSISFTPDGRKIFAAGYKTIKSWDASSGDLLLTVQAHSGFIFSIAVSPDGKRIASAGEDSTIRLWDATTGELTRTFHASAGAVNSVSFSPDGGKIASGGKDRAIRILDALTGNLLETITGHSASVTAVAFLPDGERVCSTSLDGNVSVWNVRQGSLARSFQGHTNTVSAIALSRDGTLLASVSSDSSICLWDPATGAILMRLVGHSAAVKSIAISPDGKLLSSGSDDETVRLWDLAAGSSLHTMRDHHGSVYSVAFSPDGKKIASGGYDSRLRLWDVPSGSLVKTVTVPGFTGEIFSVAFSPDGTRIACGSSDGTMRQFDASTGSQISSYYYSWFSYSDVLAAIYSPDGKTIATIGFDRPFNCREVTLWDPNRWNTLNSWQRCATSSIAFFPDGKKIVLAEYSGKIGVFDVDEKYGDPVSTLWFDNGSPNSICFRPDGKIICGGWGFRNIRIYDIANAIYLSTYVLSFSAVRNGPLPPSQTFLVKNSGVGDLDWSVGSDVDWLQLEPINGSGAGTVTVRVKTTNMDPNTHSANITIIAPGIYGTLPKVHVDYDVLPEYSLSQNYPNPFQSYTRFRYSLPEDAFVSLKMYNCLGEEVQTLIEGKAQPGTHVVFWVPQNLPTGVYFSKLRTDKYTDTKKMLYFSGGKKPFLPSGLGVPKLR